MARTIDRLIDYIREMDGSGGLSPVMKRVLIDRIEQEPTPAEIERARQAVRADQEAAVRG